MNWIQVARRIIILSSILTSSAFAPEFSVLELTNSEATASKVWAEFSIWGASKITNKYPNYFLEITTNHVQKKV